MRGLLQEGARRTVRAFRSGIERKLFVFVLYVIFSDGTQERVELKHDTTAAECAALLVRGADKPLQIPYRIELAQKVVLACEEEEKENS